MAHLFYTDHPLPDPGGLVAMTGSEARHAALVTRLRPGEVIHVADGAGERIIGPVITADRERVEVRARQRRSDPRPEPGIVLAQALAKGGRDELAIQTATELGAEGVIPWQASRSIVRWRGEKARRGHERWASIVREAAKQSMRAAVPQLSQLAHVQQLSEMHEPAAGKLVAVLDPAAPELLADACRVSGVLYGARRLIFVVGPEGGFAPEELTLLADAGCPVLRLGSPVLRTSTAGPAAITATRVLLGGWE